MIDKVKSITSEGLVTFTTKGKDSAGTLATCSAYGYHYMNGKCYAFKGGTYRKTLIRRYSANNTVLNNTNDVYGAGNTVGGYNNCVKGYHNIVDGKYNTVLGSNLYTQLDGSLTYGNYKESNRARNMYITYGGTTTDATTTELTLLNDNKFYVDETYKSAYLIEYTAVALNAASNEAWTEHGYYSYKYANNRLSSVGTPTHTTKRDSNLDYDVEILATTGTPDYLRVVVTGEAAHTAYWNVTLNVTEVRYG